MTMNDEKTKKKAIEAVADIYGVDSIAADVKEQKLTVIGEMDTVAIAKKLKKIGKVDIVTVGPAKEEKKDEKKDEKKGEKNNQNLKLVLSAFFIKITLKVSLFIKCLTFKIKYIIYKNISPSK
ncbi:hypothetical protein ERO13_D12G229600v2 [Gossypium hirsutum]|uniref:Heavy metal-associated isoprenylated plant protein 39 n=5 Tax=Gossypium TaxID=3633 RepID=A0ABM3B8H1_GOSHI|nr:heavy metal-associated isoprenylated plant protein 39-like [Gossypium hirsutum]KAB2000761.1 hypothetical protein ES319_D12G254200v1 [Gossypium barbadense]KAG4117414.1 hypothetical protein ERO13_D12G229600v2 [Gossypium hirsutum]TYG42580.1 hypothetical protein ES288_D12G268500v1 [Gossypium darwinii]TYH40752.1 hypothetical protein ES332_D12G269800v1 [Gossypium tomentosum]